jgi:hypothetical protein
MMLDTPIRRDRRLEAAARVAVGIERFGVANAHA